MAHCRICSGSLRLLYPGSGDGARSEAFSPTCHEPGRHGDLYACDRCGAVQQPSLPRGERLLGLYRAMEDERYLDEEEGRRRTARRVLGLVPPGGRLLDVGCGHGLLLDEARALGFAAEGLELSTGAAAWARGRFGVPVREEPLEALDEPGAFAAIVMADVLEHLDDPLAALDHARALLEPGGVLVVVTPDPRSRMARLAGPRWWGYLPAHTVLLPRATLRRVLVERGFEVVEEGSLVRTFTLRYWMAGLAERGGLAGRAVSFARRFVPARVRVSLSLGDEAVVVAVRGGAQRGSSAVAEAPTVGQ